MQLNNFVLSKSIILKILYIALFYIFVTPYSVAIANQGVPYKLKCHVLHTSDNGIEASYYLNVMSSIKTAVSAEN